MAVRRAVARVGTDGQDSPSLAGGAAGPGAGVEDPGGPGVPGFMLYPPEPPPPRLAAVYTPRWFTGADLPRVAGPARQGGRFRRWMAGARVRAYRWAARLW